MKNSLKFSIGIVVLLLLIVIFNTLFTVREGQQALVLRLGVLQTLSNGQSDILQPGLHVRTPFISQALIFDTRLQTLDVDSSRIVTAEKKDVIVDYYVKWRITNLAQFYTRTGGDISRAQILLEQQVNNGLRAQFGNRTISEVVSDRSSIMQHLQEEANNSAQPLGLDVIDVRIKAIDLPPEVSVAVFERMRAERMRVAAEHRANGKSEAEAIRAGADANASVILAKATEQSAQLRALGDSKAAKIYALAYNKDPKFYAFYRSMEAYQMVFNSKDNVLVLSPNNQFFEYMGNTTQK